MQECGDEQQLCFFTIKTLLTKYEADKCPGKLDMNNEASN